MYVILIENNISDVNTYEYMDFIKEIKIIKAPSIYGRIYLSKDAAIQDIKNRIIKEIGLFVTRITNNTLSYDKGINRIKSLSKIKIL